ncbi:hypothetical protein [Candidatus Ruminimicrobiellum ovillum]|uniref:hypothetical protein n=1 Tax=Candidatus Ruminimicrobiellum ovillum TaxID=1947927 RepID=UPI00355A8838
MDNEEKIKVFGKTIIPFGAHPENHEIEIAKILNKYGKSVEFLVPANIKNIRTPDIKMDNYFGK